MKKTLSFSIFWLLTLSHTISFGQKRLVNYNEQWQFEKPGLTIILTSDQQLIDLTNPDKQIELSTRYEPRWGSLRMIRDTARAKGVETVKLAFDNFFRQYRQESNPERNLTPDDDKFIAYIKKISDFLGEYKIGLELSLLSPLEIGKAYTKATGESGRWVQFITDVRDPMTGAFSVMIWEHLAWSNNKGKVRPVLKNIRAFAYTSEFGGGAGYKVVRPDDIKEISSEIRVDTLPGTKFPETQSFEAQRIRIYCDQDDDWKGYNRVYLLLSYDVPEMDYFSPDAMPFLKNLMKKYYDAGIKLDGLYSDEMHIQQDWDYFGHHDRGQFTMRYLTDNFSKAYAATYGDEYQDMEKMMIYFVNSPEVYSPHVTAAKKNYQIVMGDTPEDIQRTALFRDRYYKMLNSQVVDLFLGAKRYAESLYGWELLTRAHATWAQSPTIDYYDNHGSGRNRRNNYEYTSNFIWSNTVHQAASACYDYFKWGEYLTAMGTDHTEGGMGDRNYYAAALASSFGMVNKYPNAYNGAWGMPDKVKERNIAIFSAYGAANAFNTTAQITERVHRDVDVLMLYPMNLVASEERFGSWMTQYGYANYLTSEKVLELAELTPDGRMIIEGRDFSTLIALYEPLPDSRLLDMMERMAQRGGTVIWSGPPALIDNKGKPCLERWQEIFGVDYASLGKQGIASPGRKVSFSNALAHIPDQLIMTDFLVDYIYPVIPGTGTEIIAKVNKDIVGVLQKKGEGKTCFLGFRPRDDQAQSLGYEQRTWFEVLDALGAYPSTYSFPGFNDNTEHISRTTDYLCTRFPNRTNVIARHYRTHIETWPGGFGRNHEEDAKYLEANPLPCGRVELDKFRVNGHEVSFNGNLLIAFRLDEDKLIAFEGRDCKELIIDGIHYRFSENNIDYIAWTPVAPQRQIPGSAFFQIWLEGQGEVNIPLDTDYRKLEINTEGVVKGSLGKQIAFKYKNGIISLKLDRENTGRWLYIRGK